MFRFFKLILQWNDIYKPPHFAKIMAWLSFRSAWRLGITFFTNYGCVKYFLKWMPLILICYKKWITLSFYVRWRLHLIRFKLQTNWWKEHYWCLMPSPNVSWRFKLVCVEWMISVFSRNVTSIQTVKRKQTHLEFSEFWSVLFYFSHTVLWSP